MRNSLRLITFAVLIAPIVFAETERSITVTGTAVVQVVPDHVAWYINIADTSPDLLSAKKRNDERVAAAMELIRSLGTEPADVQTSNVSVHKEYNHDEQGRQTDFKHFVINRSISVKQRNLDRFDEFFNSLVEKTQADVNFTWQSSKLLELRKEARKRAAQIAKEKAESMLTELGATLGPVITVEETSDRGIGYPNISNTISPATITQDDEVMGTLAPGAIDVRVSVNVKFGIGD